MDAFLMTLAVICGGAGMMFVAGRLGEAQARLNLLRQQRRRDRQS